MRSKAAWITRFSHRRILLIFSASILVGFAISPDFGQSTDEYSHEKYGADAVRAYVGSDAFKRHTNQLHYGPIHGMVSSITPRLTRLVLPDWEDVDGRHFTNYAAFLSGVIALYAVCLRFVGKTPALITSLLFLSQPLLFGHAFINPKDVPFMSLFLAAIAMGLLMADTLGDHVPNSSYRHNQEGAPGSTSFVSSVKSSWEAAAPRRRTVLVVLSAVALLAIVDSFAGHYMLALGKAIISAAYDGRSWDLINTIFELVAEDAYKTPVSAYIDKATLIYQWTRVVVVLILSALAILYGRYFFASSPRQRESTLVRRYSILILAAVVLGLSTSIRPVGSFAGALVSAYMIFKMGRRSLLPLAVYWILAGLSTYLTWPYLWDDPFVRFFESLRIVSDFARHNVLYQGAIYSSLELPWHYFPRLAAIQLTEVVVVLFVLGCYDFFIRIRNRTTDLAAMILVILWFGLPVIAVAVLGVPIYGNIRHLFFVIPPIFLVAGMGIARIMNGIRTRATKVAVAALLAVPGLVGIIKLHPYEYVYYNTFVGGVEGAVGQYEIDPWCTAFRETMVYVNAKAPLNAAVAVGGPLQAARTFARDDLRMFGERGGRDADIAIACKRSLANRNFYPELRVVFEVKRGEAVFAVVKADVDSIP